jgi:hypothetical protein
LVEYIRLFTKLAYLNDYDGKVRFELILVYEYIHIYICACLWVLWILIYLCKWRPFGVHSRHLYFFSIDSFFLVEVYVASYRKCLFKCKFIGVFMYIGLCTMLIDFVYIGLCTFIVYMLIVVVYIGSCTYIGTFIGIFMYIGLCTMLIDIVYIHLCIFIDLFIYS